MSERHDYTEVTRTSLGGNLASSFGKVVFGLLMLLISFPLLWLNEGCSVDTYKALKEGAGAVVSVAADKIDPAKESKLVHVNGKATTQETLVDLEFGIQAQAINLNRQVEMYQWVEKKETKEEKQTGGGTETVTTYKYSKEWRPEIVNSSQFKKSDAYSNPESMPYASESWMAQEVQLGAFSLNSNQIGRLPGSQSLALDSVLLPPGATKTANQIYIGANPSTPELGDVRISYHYTPSGTEITLAAKQVGNSFEAYRTTNDEDIDLLKPGHLSAAQLFDAAQSENTIKTWILRGIGFLMMSLGFAALFSPILALANILPFLGNIAEFGAKLLGFLLGGIFSSLTIAVAWIFYRPLLGISLLVVSLGLTIWLFSRKKQSTAV
jgi:hypothetical protein